MIDVVQPMCSVDGCEKAADKRGWCGTHYRRWSRYGDPFFTKRPARSGHTTCTIEGCENRYLAQGFCNAHYKRWRKYGDPLHMENPTYGEGRTLDKGYVLLWDPGHPLARDRYVPEHRLVMFEAGFDIQGKDVHHKNEDTTDNRIENLEVLTRAEHLQEHGRRRTIGGTCIVEGCEKPIIARGWCGMHYARWRRGR